MSPRRGLDTKVDWLTDRQLQSDLDFFFKGWSRYVVKVSGECNRLRVVSSVEHSYSTASSISSYSLLCDGTYEYVCVFVCVMCVTDQVISNNARR
jgi:hypothetical protein